MNALELYTDQEKMYSFEGSRGVQRFEQIVKVLGYRNLTAFLEDNSGAIDAMVEFVSKWADRNSDWKDALTAELMDNSPE